MKVVICSLIAAGGLLAWTRHAHAGQPPLPPEVVRRAVAVVNGEEISREQFHADRVVSALLRKPLPRWQMEQLLEGRRRRMIRNLLIIQFVEKNKLNAPDTALEKLWQAHRLEEFRRRLKRMPKPDEPLPDAYLKAQGVKTEAQARVLFIEKRRPQTALEMKAMERFTEGDLRAYYEANQPRQISVIYFEPGALQYYDKKRADAVLAKRTAELRRVRREIQAGNRTFEAAAQSVGNNAEYKQSKGVLPVMLKEVEQEGFEKLHAAVFKLKQGEISDVITVQEGRGLMLAKVTNALSFKEARPEILGGFLQEHIKKMLDPFFNQAEQRLAPLLLDKPTPGKPGPEKKP